MLNRRRARNETKILYLPSFKKASLDRQSRKLCDRPRSMDRGSDPMKTADPFYKSKRWERKRELILRRDNYQCQESRRFGRRVPATEVHHVLPREFFPEYQWESWNLISLCAAAHNKLHSRTTHGLTLRGYQLAEKISVKNGINFEELKEKMPPPSFK